MSTEVYGTTDELKNRLNLRKAPSATDLVVYEEILAAFSRKIDNFCRRPDGFVAPAVDVTRHLAGNGLTYLKVPECVSITTVEVKDSYNDTTYDTWTTPSTVLAGDGDWFPIAGTPSRPIYDRLPFRYIMIDPNGDYDAFTESLFGLPTVKLTLKPGYSVTVPDLIREVCLAESIKLAERFSGGMDSTLGSSDLGVISMRIRQTALSRDIKELLVDGMMVLPLYSGER